MENTISQLEKRIQSTEDPQEKIDLLITIAWEVKESDVTYALSYAEQALHLAKSITDDRRVGIILSDIGVLHIMASHYQNALELFSKSEEILEQTEEQQSLALLYMRLGILYKMLCDYANSLEFLFKCLKIANQLPDKKLQVDCYCNIANVYSCLSEHRKALEYQQKSIPLLNQFDDNHRIAQVLINIGNSYKDMGDNENALENYHNGLELLESMQNKRDKAIAINNIGEIHRCLENYDNALEYFHKSVRIKRSIQDKNSLSHSLLQIGKVHLDQKEYNQSLNYLEEALTISQSINSKSQLINIYQTLSKVYQQLEEYEQALEYYQKFHSIREEVFNEKSDKKLKNLQVIHQTEIYRLKSKKLKEELMRKNRELNTLALALAQKNEFLIKLKKELNQSTHKTNSPKILHRITHQIKENINISKRENWLAFENHFHDVHPDFLPTITARYPDLTPAELRVCCFLRINLPGKDIAKALNIAYKTVENHRRHIRKKMNLSSKINLAKHIISL